MPEGSVQITFGTDDVVRRLGRLRQWVPEAVVRAQRVVARELLSDAKLFVPVLTGALKDSGRLQDAITFNDATIATQVVFGSVRVLYAATQHEGNFWHPSLGFRGPAKFLEKPLTLNGRFYVELFLVEYEAALQDLAA